MKEQRFNQFIHVERGPVKSAVIDFRKNDIYHLDNEIIDKYREGNYEYIKETISTASKRELVIEIDKSAWIPYVRFNKKDKLDIYSIGMSIVVENGASLGWVQRTFSNFNISTIYFLGYDKESPPENLFPLAKTAIIRLSYETCLKALKKVPDFSMIDYDTYDFNVSFNSCWGKKLTVTKDNTIRLCPFSTRLLIDIRNKDKLLENLDNIMHYWTMNKDTMKKCQHCEFRYICHDCREVPKRSVGDISLPNPYCAYDPETGQWKPGAQNV